MLPTSAGCFFRHSDPKALKQHLTDRVGLSLGVANDIVQLAENQHFQLACRGYFNARHPGQVSSTYRHVCRVSPVCALVLGNAINAPSSPMALLRLSCIIHQCQAFVYVVSDSLLVWNKMLFPAISLRFNLR